MNSNKHNESKSKLQKRQINAESDERYFSFYELKNHVESLEVFNEKIIYLTEEIYNYQQADIIYHNNKLKPYDLQCQHLIEQLQKMRALKAEFEREQLEGKSIDADKKPASKKIKINGPINILTDAFKQMMNSIKIDGVPYLPQKIKHVAQVICDSFTDENENSLSMSTIQTYLSPSRNDKDPNNDQRVQF